MAQRRFWMMEKRLRKDLTQEELGDLVGVTNTYISSIELGNRNPGGLLAKRIADVLDLDMKWFFEDQQSA